MKCALPLISYRFGGPPTQWCNWQKNFWWSLTLLELKKNKGKQSSKYQIQVNQPVSDVQQTKHDRNGVARTVLSSSASGWHTLFQSWKVEWMILNDPTPTSHNEREHFPRDLDIWENWMVMNMEHYNYNSMFQAQRELILVSRTKHSIEMKQ